jgi:hypothetical protein
MNLGFHFEKTSLNIITEGAGSVDGIKKNLHCYTPNIIYITS